MNEDPHLNGNAPFVIALMQEITALLGELVTSGTEGAIDLRGLPLLDQDKKHLEQMLGVGEVTAIVSTLGETQIRETAYSGVWWLRHLKVQEEGMPDKVISEQIAITLVPDILKTDEADVAASLHRLQKNFEPEGEREDEDVL